MFESIYCVFSILAPLLEDFGAPGGSNTGNTVRERRLEKIEPLLKKGKVLQKVFPDLLGQTRPI